MKKILLLFILIAVPSIGLIAQETESGSGGGGRFYAGAKAAIGMVKFKPVNSSEDFAETTWNNMSYGIVLGFNITGNLSFQVEGLWSRYGADKITPTYIYSAESPLLQSYSSTSVVDHVNMDLYYADIPLLIRYKISETGFSPYFYAGANWGINVQSSTAIVRAITIDIDKVFYREFRNDITNRILYYEFAPVAGIGLEMNIGKLSVFVDLRYKYGLMNLSNIENGTGFKNSALWQNLGLVLNL